MNAQVLSPVLRSAVLAALLAAAGCSSVGPDYQKPVVESPPAYKAAELGAWKEGEPLDHLPKGAWWEVFQDPVLNHLQAQARESNQDLRAALAAVEQARATARVARSEFFPTLDANPSFSRERYSPNQEPQFGPSTVSTFRMPLDLSYEIDLWGRVRRSFESARADAEASVAAFENFLLTLQADLAQNYFALRALDAELEVMRRAIDLRREQVQVVTGRFDAGLGTELDVARAQTELASTEAEIQAIQIRRIELENAIAILTGQAPSSFKVTPWDEEDLGLALQSPEIPAGLPSQLLERRPDVAEAERRLAAANARIGVAKAAFFPVLRLTGAGGFVSADVESLFNWESRAWSIGPSLSLPIFAGGRNRAGLQRSEAVFEEAVARYRQQVLVAFGEVENALSGIRLLAEQAQSQQQALAHASRARGLALESFNIGLTDYLTYIDADRVALQNWRSTVQLSGQRLIATVVLVRALGGGWEVPTSLAAVAAAPAEAAPVSAR